MLFSFKLSCGVVLFSFTHVRNHCVSLYCLIYMSYFSSPPQKQIQWLEKPVSNEMWLADTLGNWNSKSQVENTWKYSKWSHPKCERNLECLYPYLSGPSAIPSINSGSISQELPSHHALACRVSATWRDYSKKTFRCWPLLKEASMQRNCRMVWGTRERV